MTTLLPPQGPTLGGSAGSSSSQGSSNSQGEAPRGSSSSVTSQPAGPQPPRRRRGAHLREKRSALAAASAGRDSALGRASRSRWVRYGLPALAVVSAIAAVIGLAFPSISDVIAQRHQHDLASKLDDPTFAAQLGKGQEVVADPIGRLAIPAIGLNVIAVQGVTTSALEAGPGHYPQTSMPCTEGDAAIAGHRTTYLRPFYAVDKLKPGDVIDFSSPTVSCEYAVSQAPYPVAPSDIGAIANTPGQFTLTLTTCNPIGYATQRLIVKAVMVPTSLRSAPAPA